MPWQNMNEVLKHSFIILYKDELLINIIFSNDVIDPKNLIIRQLVAKPIKVLQ
jgi:hypothetical protein